jgi:hypothetical protein
LKCLGDEDELRGVRPFVVGEDLASGREEKHLVGSGVSQPATLLQESTHRIIKIRYDDDERCSG